MGEEGPAEGNRLVSAPSANFFQRLLCAELPPGRARQVALSIQGSTDPERSLLASPLLSDVERDRVRTASLDPLDGVLTQGVVVLEPHGLPSCAQDSEETPAALFAWGETNCLRRPTVAIVGTRGASAYGKAVAQKFAEAFAHAGVTVVSGGALGVDAAAHKGAMLGGGSTVAVLLTGIERVYPSVHAGLFSEIRQKGCLVSQFAVSTSGTRDYRPLMRNRTIALLSEVVLVVEAPERSGSLSTAAAAVEMGRPVYVVPAGIDMESFRGSHALIRDGATLVDHPDQLLAFWGLKSAAVRKAVEVEGVQKAILDALSVHPLACEFIVEKTGLDAAIVMSELTMLEVDGLVLRDAGGYAIRP